MTITDIKISNYSTMETSRGLAYTATILRGDKKIGMLENQGIGGTTAIHLESDKEWFKNQMLDYFKALGWDTTNSSTYSLEYTFAEHLLDIHEDGKVSDDSLEMGLLV